MAIKGLSKLVMANYEAQEDTVTYTNPSLTEGMAEYGLELNQSEDNPLYLDNNIKEQDAGTFQSGTLKVTTGDLSQENAKLILGVKEIEVEIGGKSVKELVFDDMRKPQTLGTGFIELHQVNNVDQYKAIWLHKVMFAVPSDAATTKKEKIEWQTREISATVMRSDACDEHYVHPWKTEAWFSSEQEALDYLMFKGGKQVGDTQYENA